MIKTEVSSSMSVIYLPCNLPIKRDNIEIKKMLLSVIEHETMLKKGLYIVFTDRHSGSLVERQLCDGDVAGHTKAFKNGTSCSFAWCSALRK